jgi:hypothetical protein
VVVLAPLQKKSQSKIFLAEQSQQGKQGQQSPATSPPLIAPIQRMPHIVAITHSESAKPDPAASHSPGTAQQIQLPGAMLLHPPTPPTRHGFGLLTVVFLVVVIPISLARLRR